MKKYSRSSQVCLYGPWRGRDPDPQEARPDVVLQLLRQRTEPLARSPLTAQIVGPLVQHPLHGARGPSASAALGPLALDRQPPHCSRTWEATSTRSRAISRGCPAAHSRRPGLVRGHPASLTLSARGRGHCGGLRRLAHDRGWRSSVTRLRR